MCLGCRVSNHVPSAGTFATRLSCYTRLSSGFVIDWVRVFGFRGPQVSISFGNNNTSNPQPQTVTWVQPLSSGTEEAIAGSC